MQLAEVFDKTQAPAPPPRPKRRRWLLWLFALVAFGAALFVHGPGVSQVPGQTALVITNDTGLAFFGPPARVTRKSAGLAFWVPIAQHAWRIPLRRHRPEAVAFTARTQDDVALTVRAATLAFSVNPDKAARVFLKYGHKSRVLDAAARGELAWAWSKVIAEHSAADLASVKADALVPAVRRVLEERLLPEGVVIQSVSAARWQAPSAILDGLADRHAAELELVKTQKTASTANDVAAVHLVKTQALWDTERQKQAAILEAQFEAAGMQAAADLDEARRDAESALSAARSERARLFTQAQVIEAIAPNEARALAARTAGLAAHGAHLLDEAILSHVLPQVDGVQTPPVDEDAP